MKGCRPFTDEEVERMLATVDNDRYHLRNRLMILFGCKVGFRISEILSLQVKDVFQHGVVPNHVEVKRRNSKGKKAGRTKILHQKVKDAIIEYLLSNLGRKIDPKAPLFESQVGYAKPITRQQAYNIIHNAAEKCELTGKIGTHSCRKTFARNVYERSGKCLIKTQKALDHTDIRTTVQYLGFAESEVESIILQG